MLADLGDRVRARELASAPLVVPAAQAEADELLGRLAYWDGDLTTALRRFEAALRENPTHAAARRQRTEILSMTAPSVRMFSAFGHDDQPVDRLAVGVEAGWHATPLTVVTARLQPNRYQVDGSTNRTLWAADVMVTHFAPALRLDTELTGGVLRRSFDDNALDWKGRAVVGVRLPAHVRLVGRIERMPYVHTVASLDTRVNVGAAAGLVRWDDPRGWLGEAAFEHRRYPDDNAARSVYVWQLVPLLHRSSVELQAGYSFTNDDADDSRFVLATSPQPFPPGDPRFSTAGVYDPYYTPARVVAHSAIGAVTLRPSRTTTLHLGSSYAIHATEDAPVLYVDGDQVLRTFYSRSFSPWNARGSLELALRPDVTLLATGETSLTAFYRTYSAGLELTYRFRTADTDRNGAP